MICTWKEKQFIIKWKPPLNINKTWLFYYFIFNDYLSNNRNNFIFLQFNFKKFVKNCWIEKIYLKLVVNILIIFLCSPFFSIYLYLYLYIYRYIILYICMYIYNIIYIYMCIYIYIYPQARVSSFPGLISVDRVTSRE